MLACMWQSWSHTQWHLRCRRLDYPAHRQSNLSEALQHMYESLLHVLNCLGSDSLRKKIVVPNLNVEESYICAISCVEVM